MCRCISFIRQDSLKPIRAFKCHFTYGACKFRLRFFTQVPANLCFMCYCKCCSQCSVLLPMVASCHNFTQSKANLDSLFFHHRPELSRRGQDRIRFRRRRADLLGPSHVAPGRGTRSVKGADGLFGVLLQSLFFGCIWLPRCKAKMSLRAFIQQEVSLQDSLII